MKLNGALKPHGAYPIGGSIGAKNKYRDKIHSNNNNNSTRNNKQNLSSLVYEKRIHSVKPEIVNQSTTTITVSEEDSDNIENCYYKSLSSISTFKSVNQRLLNNFNQSNRLRRNNNRKSTSTISKNRMMDGNGKCKITGDTDGKFNNNNNNYNNNNNNNINNKMRVQQSLFGYEFPSSLFILCLFYVFILLPNQAYCDDNDNSFFINHLNQGPDMTTPEFDYASRGNKKFGDKCNNTLECGFPGSICDAKKKACQCTEDLPITNHIDKCGKEAAHNESCFFNEQCESFFFQTECRDGRCICRFELQAVTNNGKFDCVAKQGTKHPEQYVDPAMIGVLVGMALMFIIICVVLRLFSQARWHENRTIFNTPNPRLMNVSLLRESKLLHGQERRGSRMSVRAPSRQPSMASLRPHSPNPSLASRPGSRGSNSNGSGHSFRSRSDSASVPQHNNSHTGGVHHSHNHHHNEQRKNSNSVQHQPLITNIVQNPVPENVTVEIIEPTKEQTDI